MDHTKQMPTADTAAMAPTEKAKAHEEKTDDDNGNDEEATTISAEEETSSPMKQLALPLDNLLKMIELEGQNEEQQNEKDDDDDFLHNEIARLSETQEEIRRELNSCELDRYHPASSISSSSSATFITPNKLLFLSDARTNQFDGDDSSDKISPLSFSSRTSDDRSITHQKKEEEKEDAPISSSLFDRYNSIDPSSMVGQEKLRLQIAYQKVCCVTLFCAALWIQVRQLDSSTTAIVSTPSSASQFWIKIAGMALLCYLAANETPQMVVPTSTDTPAKASDKSIPTTPVVAVRTRRTKLLVVYLFLWAKLVNFMFNYQIVIQERRRNEEPSSPQPPAVLLANTTTLPPRKQKSTKRNPLSIMNTEYNLLWNHTLSSSTTSTPMNMNQVLREVDMYCDPSFVWIDLTF